MPKWVRLALGVVVGLLVGGASLAVLEMLGHQFAAGQAVFIVAVFGLGVAALFGGSIALLICKAREVVWIISGVLAALSLMNVVSFEHPIWFVPVGIVMLGIGTWSAIRLHETRTSK